MPESFVARNPEFEAVVRASFARQAMMATLGARLTLVEAGRVTVAFARTDRLTQQHGFVHAGAIASVADSACGYAAFTLAPPGADVLSVEFKVNLVAPARAPEFEARARVLRAGATLTSCYAEVFGLDAGRETLVAAMLATIVTRTSGGRAEP